MQGRLRKQKLTVRIDTACGCCGRPLRLMVDEEMRFSVDTRGADPLLFEPNVDWGAFRGRDITRVYWRESRFFWSEEHARKSRKRRVSPPPGTYLRLAQAALAGRIAQSALFAIPWKKQARTSSREYAVSRSNIFLRHGAHLTRFILYHDGPTFQAA